jgi:hypothetical protein
MQGHRPDPPPTAAEQFDRQAHRHDGVHVVASLAAGLNTLRDLFYERTHFDVEQHLGVDSMMVPLSELKTQHRTRLEVEAYQTAESAWYVHQAQYLGPQDAWYLSWLGQQRLGKAATEETTTHRLREYETQTPDARRQALMNHLLGVLPESGRAPLVLFSLLPLAVHLATALAFSDRPRVEALRRQQLELLPAIADCRECRGRVQENGTLCKTCGNPLWKYSWLTST